MKKSLIVLASVLFIACGIIAAADKASTWEVGELVLHGRNKRLAIVTSVSGDRIGLHVFSENETMYLGDRVSRGVNRRAAVQSCEKE